MSRGASTDCKTAAAAGTVYPALLGWFDFSGGAVRLWTGVGDLSWDSATWTGGGDLVGVDPVHESNEVRAHGLGFRLNGIPSAMVTRILSEGYRNRGCKLWLALFSSLHATSPIADPVLLFSGRMDQCDLEDSGESASIVVRAESRLVDLQRPRERRRTDEDQRGLFPGDLGLEYVTGLQAREIAWGPVNPGTGPAGPSLPQSAPVANGTDPSAYAY